MDARDLDKVDEVDKNSDKESSDKTIFKILKQLAKSKNSVPIALTEKEIVNVLNEEFDCDIRNFAEQEMKLYLSVIETNFKNWPDWEKFTNDLVNYRKKSPDAKEEFIEINYTNLLSHIVAALKTAITEYKEALKEVGDCNDSQEETDMVLEIVAPTSLLDKLIFRHPNPQLNNTIFNVATQPVAPPPSQFKVTSIKSILNREGVKLQILSPTARNEYIYTRETKHEYNYVLVNKKLQEKPTPPQMINQELQVQNGGGRALKSAVFLKAIKTIGTIYGAFIDDLHEILDFVVTEMLMLPTNVFAMRNYRRRTNFYPYVRYLYEDAENVSTDVKEGYDLQLEETIIPLYEFYLGDPDIDHTSERVDDALVNAVTITCTSCLASFTGKNVVWETKSHFTEHHQNEVDFKCSNCAQEFSVEALAHNSWSHKC